MDIIVSTMGRDEMCISCELLEMFALELEGTKYLPNVLIHVRPVPIKVNSNLIIK